MALPTIPGESHGRQQAREAIADMSRNVMDARGLYAVEWIGQPGYKCGGRGCQANQVQSGDPGPRRRAAAQQRNTGQCDRRRNNESQQRNGNTYGHPAGHIVERDPERGHVGRLRHPGTRKPAEPCFAGDGAGEHARSEGYVFVGPVEVEIRSDPSTRAGRYRVTAEVREGLDGLAAASLILSDGSRIVLGNETVEIGRLPECTIALSDPNVSRRHAEIRRHGSDVVVADLQSSNGTTGKRVPGREA